MRKFNAGVFAQPRSKPEAAASNAVFRSALFPAVRATASFDRQKPALSANAGSVSRAVASFRSAELKVS